MARHVGRGFELLTLMVPLGLLLWSLVVVRGCTRRGRSRDDFWRRW